MFTTARPVDQSAPKTMSSMLSLSESNMAGNRSFNLVLMYLPCQGCYRRPHQCINCVRRLNSFLVLRCQLQRLMYGPQALRRRGPTVTASQRPTTEDCGTKQQSGIMMGSCKRSWRYCLPEMTPRRRCGSTALMLAAARCSLTSLRLHVVRVYTCAAVSGLLLHHLHRTLLLQPVTTMNHRINITMHCGAPRSASSVSAQKFKVYLPPMTPTPCH